MEQEQEFERLRGEERKIQELLHRGVTRIYPSVQEFEEKLHSGKQLKIYMGIDPTGKSLHIGHVVQLHKLRQFQELGHQVILLIGDFTGMIGDPTDKTATRTRLSREQVLENARDYAQQAGKILDINAIQIKYNSEWLASLSFSEVIELAAEVTVQQMLKRSMFQQRMRQKKPIHLHEFLYPLMQAYDSVAMGVDVEVGGNDQVFNMLLGSEMVRRHLGKQKFVVAGTLLADPKGEKIGKTRNRKEEVVWLNDGPLTMFQKIMLWPDRMIPLGFELCTRQPWERAKEAEIALKEGTGDPFSLKKDLAETIVAELTTPEAAKQAREVFENRQQTKYIPQVEIALFPQQEPPTIIDILVAAGLAKSRGEAKRLLRQGGIRLDGKQIKDADYRLDLRMEGRVVSVGKRAHKRRRLHFS